ncbi:MAG: hypothetical protein RIC87_12565 [Kiloniellales bacterium]
MDSRKTALARLHALEGLTIALCVEAGAPEELVEAYRVAVAQRDALRIEMAKTALVRSLPGLTTTMPSV